MVPDNQQTDNVIYIFFVKYCQKVYSGPSNMILGLSDSLGHRELSAQKQADGCEGDLVLLLFA